MGTIRVFVVSDSIIYTAMLTRILEAEDDIEIVGEATTGQGGIIMLEEVEPHVVLLDVSISGGMQLTDIVREMKQISENVEIILCADARTTEKIIEASEVGARDFIIRPYKKEVVLRIVREAMQH